MWTLPSDLDGLILPLFHDRYIQLPPSVDKLICVNHVVNELPSRANERLLSLLRNDCRAKMQNGFVESLNGGFGYEYLSETLLSSFSQARRHIIEWKKTATSRNRVHHWAILRLMNTRQK